MIVCVIAILSISFTILISYIVFDHIITNKRLKINQREWDEYSEGMSKEEKEDVFLDWLKENKQKHGWDFLYIPHM